jgi:hypothetical protein
VSTPTLLRILRRALLGALILALGACNKAKTGDALLIVIVKTDGLSQDVVSFRVWLSTMSGSVVMKSAPVEYASSDGGAVEISAKPRPILGVTVPGDTGDVTVTLEAYGAGMKLLGSGTSESVTPHTGERSSVEITLSSHPDVDGGTSDSSPDSGDSGGSGGVAGANAAGAAGGADASGAGGMAGAGAAGAAGSGGAGGAGQVVDRNWAQWPMPNNPADLGPDAAFFAEMYTDPGDGTVFDQVTHLTWQLGVAEDFNGVPAAMSQVEAAAFCQNLILGAYSDWRVPSLIELVSIVDDANAAPSIDPTFGLPPAGFFWSSTPLAGPLSRAWGVSFVGGNQLDEGKLQALFVRCVRADAAAGGARYTPLGGSIRDNKTTLIWQPVPAAATMNQADASAFCHAQPDHYWRLPSKNELLTIVDYSRSSPAIDQDAFPETPSTSFWSSTRLAHSETEGWSVSFDAGVPSSNPLTTLSRVRCVK